MKYFTNNNRKYIFTDIITIIIVVERFVDWLMDENSPPKIVIIITKLAVKFNLFNSGSPNGFVLSSRAKNSEIIINIKKALFW